MAIKAKNMNVGGLSPPTPTKETKPVSNVSFTALRTKAAPKEEQKPFDPPPVIVQEEEPKYIQKTDGELIRHINKKSHYLRDMLEISN